MRKTTQPLSGRLTAVDSLDQSSGKPTNMYGRDLAGGLLLRHPNFVAKSAEATLDARSLACEASALTTEPTAQGRIYFSPRNHLCKHI